MFQQRPVSSNPSDSSPIQARMCAYEEPLLIVAPLSDIAEELPKTSRFIESKTLSSLAQKVETIKEEAVNSIIRITKINNNTNEELTLDALFDEKPEPPADTTITDDETQDNPNESLKIKLLKTHSIKLALATVQTLTHLLKLVNALVSIRVSYVPHNTQGFMNLGVLLEKAESRFNDLCKKLANVDIKDSKSINTMTAINEDANHIALILSVLNEVIGHIDPNNQYDQFNEQLTAALSEFIDKITMHLQLGVDDDEDNRLVDNKMVKHLLFNLEALLLDNDHTEAHHEKIKQFLSTANLLLTYQDYTTELSNLSVSEKQLKNQLCDEILHIRLHSTHITNPKWLNRFLSNCYLHLQLRLNESNSNNDSMQKLKIDIAFEKIQLELDNIANNPFKEKVTALYQELRADIEKQFCRGKSPEKVLKSDAYRILQETTTMLRCVGDSRINPKEKILAIDTFEVNCKIKSSAASKFFKLVATVIITGIAMFTGAAIGFAAGAFLGAPTGAGAAITALIGMTKGAITGYGIGLACATTATGVVCAGVSTYGFFGSNKKQRLANAAANEGKLAIAAEKELLAPKPPKH